MSRLQLVMRLLSSLPLQAASSEMISLIDEDFNPFAKLQNWHEAVKPEGGVCHFIGTMRALDSQGNALKAIYLEHYPTMCEKMLENIIHECQAKFAVKDVLLCHRIGMIYPLQTILLLGVSAPHRGESFQACEFIADFLKSDAPFWKQEIHQTGAAKWVEANAKDTAKKAGWL